MKAVSKLINQYSPISLSEMDNVKLLNRTDTKYVCSVFKLKEILNDLSELYKILEIDGQRIMSYKTKYYDTEDFRMYYQHQNGKLNRYKIREREYVNSELNFLEVKFKNNKNRTIKSRMKKPGHVTWFSNKEIDFLDLQSPFSSDTLEVKLFNTFNRITLCNDSERVTIDFRIKFSNVEGFTKILPFIAIIELKQARYSLKSEVVKSLKKYNVRPLGFSKYCIGTSILYPDLKSNRLKSKLLLINKISA